MRRHPHLLQKDKHPSGHITQGNSEKVIPIVRFEVVKDDPDDNIFIDCAVSASADYIISGDQHLLKLIEFRGIKIVTPAEFVKLLNF